MEFLASTHNLSKSKGGISLSDRLLVKVGLPLLRALMPMEIQTVGGTS